MSQKDCVIEFIQQNGIELTRENYLELKFMGDVPDKIDAETEISLPEMFQINPTTDEEEFE